MPDRMYVEVGRYSDQLTRWISSLSRDKVHVILQDDLQRNPEKVLEQLWSFLSIEHTEWSNSILQRENRSHGVRSYKIMQLLNLAKGRTRLIPVRVKRGMSRLLHRLNTTSKPEIDIDLARALAIRFEPEVEKLSSILKTDLVSRWLDPYK